MVGNKTAEQCDASRVADGACLKWRIARGERVIADVRRPADRPWRCGGNLHRLFLRIVLFHCAAALGTTIAGGTTGWARKDTDEGVLRHFRWRWGDAGVAYEGDAWELGGGA